MNSRKHLNQVRKQRVGRVRARVFGTKERPRLAIKKSNKYTSAQLIDDAAGRTLAHVSAGNLPENGKVGVKAEQARKAGEFLAKKALELGIKRAVFDRRAYQYHGRVKAFVDGARSAGLQI